MKLLTNRQFWTAVLALLQTIVLNYLNVPAEIWASIDAILVIIIGVYTVEDIETIKAESAKEIATIYSEALSKGSDKIASAIAKIKE